jgi:hypothetical protein
MHGMAVAAMGRSYDKRCRQAACYDRAGLIQRIHD